MTIFFISHIYNTTIYDRLSRRNTYLVKKKALEISNASLKRIWYHTTLRKTLLKITLS